MNDGKYLTETFVLFVFSKKKAKCGRKALALKNEKLMR